MEDYYGDFAGRSGGGMAAFGRVAREEFQEDEIWAIREATGKYPKVKKVPSSSPPWRFATTAARPIPRTSEYLAAAHGYSSAPVNIPDWSKILKQQQQQPPPRKKFWDDDDDGGGGDGWRRTSHDHHVKDDDDDDDYDDDGMVPPHEYLARTRKHANVKNVSFSMCEGVGGTLKGRDLCKLRNAILTKTGFLE